MKKILIALFLTLSCSVRAEEVIRSYDVLIRVGANASATVTETITVNVEGRQIRRGLYRDLPLTHGVRYAVSEVVRDGKKEPYFVERPKGFYRINTGNEDFLPRKLTTFTITYKVKNLVAAFKDHDEVYWNATGNGWAFPIEKTTARVVLPDGAATTRVSSYIGAEGSRESGVYDEASGVFSAGRPLKRGEGLTIVVSFPKGFVVKNKTLIDMIPGAMWLIATLNISPATLLFSVLLLIYAAVSWSMYGQDPLPRSVMPRFDAPTGLTPAQAGFVYRYGQGNLLVLALAQACVSKFVSITPYKVPETGKDGFVIEKLREPKTAEERIIAEKLTFPKKLTGAYSSELELLENALLVEYSKKNDGRYFVFNIGKTFLAIFLSWIGAFFIARETGSSVPPQHYMPIGIVSLLSFVGGAVLRQNNVLAIGLFTVLYVFMFIAVPDEAARFMIVSAAFLFFYSYLIIRPTEEGQRICEHVDGIKMFLNAVQLYPTSFDDMEKLMPYAILLDMEKQFDEKMKNFAGMRNQEQPSWYHSRPDFRRFGRALSSASSQSSSSSSGHSGGSSGGGRGGGGGGGR